MASIKVAVRVRPLTDREKKLNCKTIIQMNDSQTSITNIKLPATGNWHSPKGDSFGREKVKKFTYDYSYWSVDANDATFAPQEQVFQDLGSDVVQSAHQGYNACVFAYGQTGSGKTYTMMGNTDSPGLIPRISEGLFCKPEDTDVSYRTEVSYLEIYNEKVRDLLREKKQVQASLRVREHPKDGPYVQDLSKHFVGSYADVEELIERGNSARTTAATSMNEHSSRSHAIFTIVFTQAMYEDGVPSEVRSKINLVDLAGSERADTSDSTGERLKEGGSINKSLVTLGHCISRLADMCDKSFLSSPKKQTFIPYRDSVLTWLLKDSLGGNSRTLMIATISPADCNYAETLSTLRYASQAKKIVNKPTINEDPNVKLIRELREENARLRALLGEVVDVSPTAPDVIQTKEQLNRNEEKVRKLTELWADKWQDLTDILQEHDSLALRAEGIGLVVDSELPYLLVVNGNILSTGMKLYHLKEGQTGVGRQQPAENSQYIVLEAGDIHPDHCVFLHEGGEVFMTPVGSAKCTVDNMRIESSTKLTQGCHICLGDAHMFRFNHPGQAALLREQYDGDHMELESPNRVWQTHWPGSPKVDFAAQSEPELCQMPNGQPEEKSELEEKREELESLERQHCLAEAQRLAQLAEQKASIEKLEEKEASIKQATEEAEVIKQKALKAQNEMKRLSASLEQTVNDQLQEAARLDAERSALQTQRERLELDKARAREERQKLRSQREQEAARADLERERREEVEESRHIEQDLMSQRLEQQTDIMQGEKNHQTKMRGLEKDIYHRSMSDMRKLLENEVKDMVDFFTKSSTDFSANHSMSDVTEDELDGLRLDLESKSAVPPQYLLKTDKCGSENGELLEPSDADILCDLKPLTSETLDDHVGYLATRVGDIHCKVCQALRRKYTSVLTMDDMTAGLDEHVVSQFSDLRAVYDDLDKFSKDHSLQKTIQIKLKDYDGMLSVVDKFLHIHKILQETDQAISCKQFPKAIDNLEELHGLFPALSIDSELESKVSRGLKTEMSVLRERLLFGLTGTWNNMLKWTLPSGSGKSPGSGTVTLEVTDLEADQEVLQASVKALSRLNMLDSTVKTFCDNLMEHLIKQVIVDRGTLLQVVDELDKCTLTVLRIPQSRSQQTFVPPVEAFQKLEQVLTFIHKPLSGIYIPGNPTEPVSPPQTSTSTKHSIIGRIGQVIAEDMFDSVYEHSLAPVVCKNNVSNEQWKVYSHTVQLTEKFQESLHRMGFLRDTQTSLLDKMNNVSSLFANIKNQELLKQAHELMTQDFMKHLGVSMENPLGPEEDSRLRTLGFVKVCREKAGTSDFKFPSCQISIPVCNLVYMAYELLLEAMSGSTEEALNLCHSVRGIFELYCDVVPSYHRDRLQQRHLMAGLHHNNCMFITHHLLTMDKRFRVKLQPILPANPDETVLSQLIPQVRNLGNEHLTDYLNMKKDELFFLMQEAQGFSCVADDQGKSATQAIKKMLHNLKQISNVWQKILPVRVYCRAIGSLMDAALTEIVDSILCIGEFSAEDCDYLQRALSHIAKLAADYFKIDPAKVNPHVALHEYVPSWMKFKEIVLILLSGLHEVADRWADGKGPLAMHVTGDEVRKLVLAIFENTTRRDILLKLLSRRPSVHLT